MYQRYAVYVTPDGDLAVRGAAWLGWDVQTGTPVSHPVVAGLDVAALTDTPRKYGLHGTIKPPFFLAEGATVDGLKASVAALCSELAPVVLDGLEVRALAGFVALVPTGDQTALAGLAAQVVTRLDPFRAPPSQAELARRRKTPLSPAQEVHLANWGYPYVMDQFRFHITLTRRIEGDSGPVAQALAAHFAPALPAPFMVQTLTLVGQRADGMFEEIHRYALSG